jgi:hypothetical protein
MQDASHFAGFSPAVQRNTYTRLRVTAIALWGTGRNPVERAESNVMPDLAGMLLRRSLGAVSQPRERCTKCERTPLAGERLHEMDTGRLLCDLCLAALPEDDRRAVRSERVHAGEVRLAVVPRAA